MSGLRLVVSPHAYELLLDGRPLARLDAGASALLAGAGARLRESDLEAAIERAEDWLMPSSRSIEGMRLDVRDATGRLRERLGGRVELTADEVERAFARAHDDVVRGLAADAASVADVVLLRELAHHGRLSGVVLGGPDPER